MIVIIDYGMGNLKSVYNAFKRLDCDIKISDKIEDIKSADGLILPGVGAFIDCMKNLNNSGLVPAIKEEVAKGKPILGICLGMQVMFEKGYEGKECEGLGLLKGEITLMNDPNVRIPHIGWNDLIINHQDEMIKDLNEHSYVYYVHSYCASKMLDENLIAYSEYGSVKIPGLVRKGNIIGAQFHPEKSGEEGLKILKNFKELIKC